MRSARSVVETGQVRTCQAYRRPRRTCTRAPTAPCRACPPGSDGNNAVKMSGAENAARGRNDTSPAQSWGHRSQVRVCEHWLGVCSMLRGGMCTGRAHVHRLSCYSSAETRTPSSPPRPCPQRRSCLVTIHQPLRLSLDSRAPHPPSPPSTPFPAHPPPCLPPTTVASSRTTCPRSSSPSTPRG